MEERMIKFLKSIKCEDPNLFDIDFISIHKSRNASENKKAKYNYAIKKNTPFTYNQLIAFREYLKNIDSYDYEIIFTYGSKYNVTTLKKFIDDFILTTIFEDLTYSLKINGSISITFGSFSDYELFKSISSDLEEIFYFMSLDYNLVVDYDENLKEEDIFNTNDYRAINNLDNPSKKEEITNNQVNINNDEVKLDTINVTLNDEDNFINYEYEPSVDIGEIKNDDKNIEEDLLSNDLTNPLNYEKLKKATEEHLLNKDKEEKKYIQNRANNHSLYQKASKYTHYEIENLPKNNEPVEFNGKVNGLQIKEGKNGTSLFFSVYNLNQAINCRYQIKENEDVSNVKNEENILIQGKIDYSRNEKDPTCIVHSYQTLGKDKLRDDLEEVKRVELHLHTKFSELDGVSTMDEYCELASHMGMKAIGVTDHGVVQAFPDAQNAAKKYNIKMLYGAELYVIDDNIHAAINPTDISLKDATYVVFDLETTGLNMYFDRITEFGAVKVQGGMVVDRLDILINPEIKISQKIQNLTHITQEIVDKLPPIKEVMTKILDFIGDSILVAHNGIFDYTMLNVAYKRIYNKPLIRPLIDTLPLSRYFFPFNRDHKVGDLCKRLDVYYNSQEAHRGDYDAGVLASCWNGLRAMLLEKNPDMKHKDLENLVFSRDSLKHIRGRHTTVFAKNREGLKDLYRIISDSCCKYIGLVPLVPLKLLEDNRKNLLVGSGCFNGEVMQAVLYYDDEALKKAVSLCDYIEIQPLRNYYPVIFDGTIDTEDQLKELLRLVIKEAENQGKIIVATSDCHYANKEEKIYRDIIIQQLGVGGVRHPLSRKGLVSPEQYFLTTREMLDEFKWINDDKKSYDWVVTNTNKIADMCDEIIPIDNKLYTPEIDNCEQMLTDMCYKKAHEEYGDKLPSYIENRLKQELDGIIGNGYSVTYYIAHELIRMTNERGYIVGSRGSVGSSFAAYCANITEVNPLPPHYRCPHCKHVEFHDMSDGITSGYDLPKKKCPECGVEMISDGQNIPFETFLGFHAEKVPDIDLNFPANFQSTAHTFTKVLLGEDNVFRAGTISTIKDKTAFGYVRKYFETIGANPDSLRGSYVAALANGCIGIKRTTGQHPGGIVVVPRKYSILDFTPVQYPANDTTVEWKTTHFDFHSIHDTILKLDMLGHVDPQALKMMCDLANVDLHSIPFNDPNVLSIFQNNDALKLQHKYIKADVGTSGIPEFGTNFVKELVRETKPKCFKDLLIISGLSHGTDVWNNNAQDLIKNRITDLNGVIGCRDDIMSFLISKGLDNSKAFAIMETVRKGKKLSDEQILDMESHNVPSYYIESCKKIKYLFPKGHACAYVMMALRVGYFKVYYPLEFYATFFTLRCDQYEIETMIGGIDQIARRINDLTTRAEKGIDKLSEKESAVLDTLTVCLEFAERGFKFKPIDITKSMPSDFVIDKKDKSLIPPFKVLEGVGESAGQSIIEARSERPFESIDDFTKRSKLPPKAITQLKDLGSFKGLPENEELSLFDDLSIF